MRYFLLIFLMAVVAVVGIAGFRGEPFRKPPIELIPDMDRQPKIRPQSPSKFFADGRASRLPVAGTVSRGASFLDIPLNTGAETGTTNWVETIPAPVTAEMVARGQDRYQIYCSPCHGALGDGNGITKKFGMGVVANLHDRRIVELPDGEIFHVISAGRNLMGGYAESLEVNDRWAVVAYVRALQLSRLGSDADLTESQRASLNK